ncbi:MAG: replicative DNA helicase [Chloroflexi bacterium]|nr:replicative DNA helicase [Chloroflexota bacterium]
MAVERLDSDLESLAGEARAEERDLSLPPHSLQAEEAVLGSILKHPPSIVRVSDFLKPEDFYGMRNRHVFRAMLTLFTDGKPIDYHSVGDTLYQQGTHEAAGGMLYLSEVNLATPSAAYIEYYGRIVERTSIARQLIAHAQTIAELAYRDNLAPETLLEKAEQLIYAISEKRVTRDFRSLEDVLAEYMEQIEALQEGEATRYGIPTGYADLDKLLGGFQRTDLIILAARTSVGKTSFALNLAVNAAVKHHATVAVFSLEMSAEQLASRLLSMESGVDSPRIRSAHLNEQESRKLDAAMNHLARAPIWVDDTPSIPIMELRSKARRLAGEHNLDMIIVDYLQLVATDGGESRVQEIGQISRALKALARELRVPVLALSQLSRAVEQRTPHIPQLSDLRESGCLAGDTRVALASGELVPIASLEGQTPEVLTMDGLRLTTGHASRVWRTGHRPVRKLKTRSGRAIRATGNHKFRTLWGWTELEELRVGDRVAIPRKHPEPSKPARWDDSRVVLLAHLIGDGCYASRQPIHYTSASQANLNAVELAALDAFGIVGRRVAQSTWTHLYLTAGASKWHLWATDGSIYTRSDQGRRRAAIYYATSSYGLATDVQHLLSRLAIGSTIRTATKAGYDPAYHVSLAGCLDRQKFAERIGGFGDRVSALAQVVELEHGLKSNTNVDTIPREVWAVVRSRMRDRRFSQRAMTVARGTSYGGASHFRFAPSRALLADYARILHAEDLQAIASSDVYWDEVTSIEEDGEEDVYDMSVPGTHNFVANGMVVHNSLEQDADVVLFIYRDEKYNPDTDKKGVADIIVAKHRNGPTGQVQLLFLERTTKFLDLEVFRA